MTRFLMATIPALGHVSPALPIVRELINRGHEVCWYTGQAFQTTVEATGAQFAPIRSWMDYSDLTNVPLVVAGQTEEKPEIAARVEWAKVGINLKTRTPTHTQIKQAVKTLLRDSSYRTCIKQLQTKMQNYNAPAIAATLIEQLATTKQPVLR